MFKLNNSKLNKLSSGFTLLEVLIATAIFAVVMVITTGVVGNSIRYQTKIEVVRRVNLDTNKIADSLSRDIRSANTAGIYKYKNFAGTGYVTRNYSSGIVLVRCMAATNCGPYSDIEASGSFGFSQHALIIFTKNENGPLAKIYFNRYVAGDKKLYYLEIPSNEVTSDDIFNMSQAIAGGTIDGVTEDIKLMLAGFAPDDVNAVAAGTLAKQQPFVSFEITSSISGPSPAETAVSVVRSSISLRHYSR